MGWLFIVYPIMPIFSTMAIYILEIVWVSPFCTKMRQTDACFLCHSRNDLTFISHSFQTYYTAARYSDKCCLSRPRPLITAWQNDFHILPWFRTSQDSLTETIPDLPRLTTSHDSMIESQSYLPWFRTSHDSATESSPNLPRLTTAYDGRHVRFRLGSF